MQDDGLAYVQDEEGIKKDPGGHVGLAVYADELHSAVVEAMELCPGECIFIEECVVE